MSKAFKPADGDENDLGDDLPAPPPPTGKNYLTPAGYRRMQNELYELKTKTRPEVTQVVAWAAGNGDRSENGDYLYGKKRLREIDKRIRYLALRLDAAEVVDPLLQRNVEQVFFGATVTFRNENDEVKRFAIVGMDEADITKERISWQSPLAAALMKARVGDVVQFRSPKGIQEIEIERIEYRELE